MLADGYNLLGIKDEALESLFLYFFLPLVLIRWNQQRSWSEYGLTLGRWRAGLALTLLTWVLAAGIIGMSLRLDPSLKAYYIRFPLRKSVWNNLLDLIGWEFLFRGWLLFAYARAFGPGPALLLQMVPFAILHLGKPALETFSTLFGGIWLGFMAWRSRSVLYPILGHWFISTYVIWAAFYLT